MFFKSFISDKLIDATSVSYEEAILQILANPKENISKDDYTLCIAENINLLLVDITKLKYYVDTSFEVTLDTTDLVIAISTNNSIYYFNTEAHTILEFIVLNNKVSWLIKNSKFIFAEVLDITSFTFDISHIFDNEEELLQLVDVTPPITDKFIHSFTLFSKLNRNFIINLFVSHFKNVTETEFNNKIETLTKLVNDWISMFSNSITVEQVLSENVTLNTQKNKFQSFLLLTLMTNFKIFDYNLNTFIDKFGEHNTALKHLSAELVSLQQSLAFQKHDSSYKLPTLTITDVILNGVYKDEINFCIDNLHYVAAIDKEMITNSFRNSIPNILRQLVLAFENKKVVLELYSDAFKSTLEVIFKSFEKDKYSDEELQNIINSLSTVVFNSLQYSNILGLLMSSLETAPTLTAINEAKKDEKEIVTSVQNELYLKYWNYQTTQSSEVKLILKYFTIQEIIDIARSLTIKE